MKYLLSFLLAVTTCGIAALAKNVSYEEGQVWAYQNRAEDRGSLLKIQKMEMLGSGEGSELVFHISLVGVNSPYGSIWPHLPVSKQTLGLSVTELVSHAGVFPDPSEGIAIWREAKGGVFTISVAEIVEISEQTMENPDRIEQQ